jgi:3-dehydroquinate dehydratase
MGPLGKFTRVMAPFYGAPFTYASFNKKVERSQIDVKTLRMIYEGLK